MAGKKPKPNRLKETYDRIRKPVPPPSRVEEDRRREMEEELLDKEAEEQMRKDD